MFPLWLFEGYEFHKDPPTVSSHKRRREAGLRHETRNEKDKMRQVNSSMIRDNTGADYRWVRRGLTLETENNKCDKHVFEQGRNGFVTICPTSEYSPWGLLTYRSELTTYVHKPAVLITCKISPNCICLRCPIRCLLYRSYRCVFKISRWFFQPPAAPRHTLLSVPYCDGEILGIWLKDGQG